MSDTIIGPGITIDGNLESDASIRVEGRVVGRIDCQANVEIGAGASVGSEVRAKKVSVGGAVAGNVQGLDRVDLLPSAQLTGDVRSPRLTMADGASFRGKVEMDAPS